MLSSPIVVEENKHLRLRCAATGNPKPQVEWRRLDGRTIQMGSWEGKQNEIISDFICLFNNYLRVAVLENISLLCLFSIIFFFYAFHIKLRFLC